MKKKVAFTLLLCVAWALSAFAQQTVESIRKEYQAVHEMIAQMTPGGDDTPEIPPEYYDLQVLQNLPGTGPHKENIRMFYGEEEQDDEEEYNPYPPHFLRFATAKYNFAAREFYEEYLYDAKGRVLFIYALTPDVGDDMVPYELRLYFDGEHLLRFTAKKHDGQNKEEFSGKQRGVFRQDHPREVPSGDQSLSAACRAFPHDVQGYRRQHLPLSIPKVSLSASR